MAFATHEDVQTRLGRDLTSTEQAAATDVIATVTGLIVDCVDRDEEWAEDLSPVPAALKAICVEKAIGAISNPHGVASFSESLGAHSYSQTSRRSADVGPFLTPFEERQVQRAVYGRNSHSSSPRSVVDRIIDLAEARDVDEEPEEE